MQKVREIMTSRPVKVGPDEEIVNVARRMRDENIGAVLVTRDENLVGLVTDRDLVIRGLAADADPHSPVSGVASDVTATVGPDDDVKDAVRLMRDKAVRRVPVMEGGKPVGIVSLGDLAIELDSSSGLADISAASPDK
jgi:CBS domain-containing protein